MPNWLNNREIVLVVVTASTSMHSRLISGPLVAAQTWSTTEKVEFPASGNVH